MKYYFTIAISFLAFNYTLAQNYVDILKVNASTTADNTFDTSTTKTKIQQIDADLTVPIKINDRLSIITGVMYETFQTKLFEDGNVKTFGSTALKLGANKQFNDHWSGTAVLIPKIASDYNTISGKDIQVGVVGIMKYKKSDNKNFKFGLYYNSELFGPFFVPMVGMYYLSPNKKFETNIMLPLQADVNYKLIPFMNIGVNFNGQIRSYHLTDVNSTHHSTYIARSTNEFYAYLKFNITKGLSLTTKIGQSLGRSYKVFNEGDKVTFGLPATFIGGKREQLNTNFSNGLIFQASLLFRIHLDKKPTEQTHKE
ncbi:MAG: hypothetical protein KBG47_06295 [Bacteroidia bacterium]|mgnify:CR=1 FL=1|nr:hypothetical protein [Sphingobacteriaceae bacterium]MBK7310030.1 hypothetical protein [Sphingobacteriaceae bacterium]MBK7818544.1 hypothetical protein [Sphingobacteriaceae bacterium]MBP9069098.1 hypothetical protein [Bacteroidia bacterium]